MTGFDWGCEGQGWKKMEIPRFSLLLLQALLVLEDELELIQTI